MAEIRTRALVLRCYDQRESDRLVHLYSEDEGRISAIAKGARRSRRRFPGLLEILTLIDARLVDPPRASLMRLEGARLVQPFEGLVNDLGRYAIACQLAELLDRAKSQPAPPLYKYEVLRRLLPVQVVLGQEPAARDGLLCRWASGARLPAT